MNNGEETQCTAILMHETFKIYEQLGKLPTNEDTTFHFVVQYDLLEY